MEFFLPAADGTDAEKAYASIKAFVQQKCGPVTGRRIYSIRFLHDRADHRATVGEILVRVGEHVVAILEGESVYYACTLNRGVKQGLPYLVGHPDVRSIEDFDIPPAEVGGSGAV